MYEITFCIWIPILPDHHKLLRKCIRLFQDIRILLLVNFLFEIHNVLLLHHLDLEKRSKLRREHVFHLSYTKSHKTVKKDLLLRRIAVEVRILVIWLVLIHYWIVVVRINIVHVHLDIRLNLLLHLWLLKEVIILIRLLHWWLHLLI